MLCRFIDSGFNDCYTNMAIDEALLHCCTSPILRIYSWKPSAISLGYNQKTDDINLEECKKYNVGIVRRITGGMAIYHDMEITYSFIMPENISLLPKDIAESYRIIAEAISAGLKGIGLHSELQQQPERHKNPLCFSSANWYELAASGKKFCGSAQRRMDGKILQHGSILIDFDYDMNISLFRTKNTVDELKKSITSIRQLIKRAITYDDIGKALMHGFAGRFGFEIEKSEPSEKEMQHAERLKKEKYSKDEWNFRCLNATQV